MVNSTKHVFYVGERAPDDYRQVKLDGMIISPKHPKGDILFLQGFSGKHEDYMHLLMPLGEEFRMVTYNNRGHPGSGGTFNAKKSAEDWKEIAKSSACDYVLAHSCGASFALKLDSKYIKGAYCIEPVFSADMLPWLMRAGISMLHAAEVSPTILPSIDSFLDARGLPARWGLSNKNPLQSFSEIGKLDQNSYVKPLAFTIADADEALGTTGKPERKVALIEKVMTAYPQARNRSNLVRGLNHCLNLTPGDFAPFLKPEKGKDSDRIIEDIINFFSE